MPIHDWTRVRSNRFHDFHQKWTVAITNSLNEGRLPDGFFAMVEQHTGGPEPDVVALELKPRNPGGATATLQPPKTRIVKRTDNRIYADKANRVTVRHPDGKVVAVIEVVSPGNKDSRESLPEFSAKAKAFLKARIHLLVVDLFPPNRLNPNGIHKVIWDRIIEEDFELPADKPLTLVSYHAGSEMVAYIEPVVVGDPLPDMPVYLADEFYVMCPLDETYQTAWKQFPAPLKEALLTPKE